MNNTNVPFETAENAEVAIINVGPYSLPAYPYFLTGETRAILAGGFGNLQIDTTNPAASIDALAGIALILIRYRGGVKSVTADDIDMLPLAELTKIGELMQAANPAAASVEQAVAPAAEGDEKK